MLSRSFCTFSEDASCNIFSSHSIACSSSRWQNVVVHINLPFNWILIYFGNGEIRTSMFGNQARRLRHGRQNDWDWTNEEAKNQSNWARRSKRYATKCTTNTQHIRLEMQPTHKIRSLAVHCWNGTRNTINQKWKTISFHRVHHHRHEHKVHKF